MNSKEALEILNIAWSGRMDKDGYPNFDDIHIALYQLEQDLELLEKLEKEYKEARKSIKSWNENGGELLRENAKLKKVIEILKDYLMIKVSINMNNEYCLDACDYAIPHLNKKQYDLLKEYL